MQKTELIQEDEKLIERAIKNIERVIIIVLLIINGLIIMINTQHIKVLEDKIDLFDSMQKECFKSHIIEKKVFLSEWCLMLNDSSFVSIVNVNGSSKELKYIFKPDRKYSKDFFSFYEYKIENSKNEHIYYYEPILLYYDDCSFFGDEIYTWNETVCDQWVYVEIKE